MKYMMSEEERSLHRNEMEQVLHTLGKSELTDECCQRLIELYKISLILDKSHVCKNPDDFETLFMVKYYEFRKHIDEQVDSIMHCDDATMEEYRKKILDGCKYLEEHYPGTQGFKDADQKISDMKNNLDLLRTLIANLFMPVACDDDVWKRYQEWLPSVDEKQLSSARLLDVDAELNRLFSLGAFSNNKNHNTLELFNSYVRDVERLGFSSNCTYRPMNGEVQYMAANLEYKVSRKRNSL